MRVGWTDRVLPTRRGARPRADTGPPQPVGTAPHGVDPLREVERVLLPCKDPLVLRPAVRALALAAAHGRCSVAGRPRQGGSSTGRCQRRLAAVWRLVAGQQLADAATGTALLTCRSGGWGRRHCRTRWRGRGSHLGGARWACPQRGGGALYRGGRLGAALAQGGGALVIGDLGLAHAPGDRRLPQGRLPR